MVDTIRQLKFMPVATSRTVLRSVRRVDLNATSTGPFCLVTQTFKKLTPCCVSNGFVDAPEIILLHIVDRQILNDNSVKPIYEFTGKLMGEVVSLICNSFVNKSNRLFSFVSYSRTFGLFRQSPLHFSEFLFFFPKESWIGQGSEVHESHVNSNRRFNWLLNGSMLNNTNECNKPLSC